MTIKQICNAIVGEDEEMSLGELIDRFYPETKGSFMREIVHLGDEE